MSKENGCLTFIGRLSIPAFVLTFIGMFEKEIRCFLKLEESCDAANRFGAQVGGAFATFLNILSITSFFLFKFLGYTSWIVVFAFFIIGAAGKKSEDIQEEAQKTVGCAALVIGFFLAFLPIYNQYHVLFLAVGFYFFWLSLLFNGFFVDDSSKGGAFWLIMIISVLISIFIFPKI